MDRRDFMAGGFGALLAGALPAAFAQSWPDRPIRAVQGFPAGGNADTIARLVGTEMSKALGQPFVVEAVTGAGGTLGSAAVARAAPDGNTILLATGGHVVAGALYDKLPYDTIASFDPVSTITFFPFLLAVPADSKFRNLGDVLSAARGAPGTIGYGTAGVGSTHHLVGELLAKMAGVRMMHVPFRGDAASIPALLGNNIPLVIAPPTAVLGHAKAGKVRVLAVTGPERWGAMPDVPTVAEQGVAGYDVRSWAGWMVPAGTPPAVIARLNAETLKALQVPAVKSRLEDMGGEARGSTPQEMRAMMVAELQKWKQVVADAGIPRMG
ncbi:Bug family tripartite tricarboxylate transporter substrate binding protein [Ramlibacter rhizophilus]|uniref:Tripartite tricarboxylate transporter substrate binding protein n=1 Tax=Ramlibacter rhizophilus TaxID=1781167 RepID=A0A4Z0BYU4_9BURK|nr:tripartite tricarboxylate transporter substrate binding protein [Ramlibacter rhizophilus]TFZ04507.1 tripartite tricarboxylate transporter substrate binding protein [Ramlibacter rhizophilus]